MVLLGLFLCFTQVIGYIYCCVRVKKIRSCLIRMKKGKPKLPRIRVTHIAPNVFRCQNIPKYQPHAGTSNLPEVVLNEFSSYARSNFLIWCRVRPREAKFLFKAILGQFQVKFGVSSVTQNGV